MKYRIKIEGKILNAEYERSKPPTLKELKNIKELTGHKVYITQIKENGK